MSESKNDWTLDTNLLINANGPALNTPQKATGTRQIARKLLTCMVEKGFICWSVAVSQEYQSRGVIQLRQGNPPIPVQNNANPTWIEAWLSSIQTQHRIYFPKVRKLTGAEEEDLRRNQFKDQADFVFLELARSSSRKRLVTQESHYNSRTVSAIHRILAVVCQDYDDALEVCSNEA